MYKNSLGGHLFLYNAIQYDYCFIEAIESLLPICDQVIVVDCGSDDGTAGVLFKKYEQHKKVDLFMGRKWDIGNGYERLRLHANFAREQLKTEWQFMLQGDEILHEDSYKWIKKAIQFGNNNKILTRRFNLFDSMDKYVKFDSKKRPCGDAIVRLAKQDIEVIGDAETLNFTNNDSRFLNDIFIVHYGFVRDRKKILKKAIDMQGWFGMGVDKRLIQDRDEAGRFRPKLYIPDTELTTIPFRHPKIMNEWINERKLTNDIS